MSPVMDSAQLVGGSCHAPGLERGKSPEAVVPRFSHRLGEIDVLGRRCGPQGFGDHTVEGRPLSGLQ